VRIGAVGVREERVDVVALGEIEGELTARRIAGARHELRIGDAISPALDVEHQPRVVDRRLEPDLVLAELEGDGLGELRGERGARVQCGKDEREHHGSSRDGGNLPMNPSS
jgi:hypothetical protein